MIERDDQVRLRRMSPGEFEAWIPAAIEDYANDHVRMGSKQPDTALESATKEFAQLLPDGIDTAEHYLFIGEATGPVDERVGILWLRIPAGENTSAFVYGVAIDPSVRGKGYGRGIMRAGEDFAREQGAAAIRLHVFGDNVVARGLYTSMGYEETNVNMAKSLR